MSIAHGAGGGETVFSAPPACYKETMSLRQNGVTGSIEGSGVFLGALALRVFHIAAIRSLPSFDHPYAGLDAALYVRLARLIASGALVPAELLHAAPLYAWYLGGVTRLFGDPFLAPRLIQAFLGATAATLLYVTTRRIAGPAAGRIAGTIAAVYPPFLLYEGTLQSAALVPFLVSLLLYLLVRAGSPRAHFLGGVVTGILVIDRPDALALLLFLPTAVAAAGRGKRRAASLAAGALLALSPVTVLSSLRAGGFVPVSAHGGIHLFIGNHDGADGRLSPVKGIEPTPAGFDVDARRLAESETGVKMTPAEVSRFWSRKAIAWMSAHPGRLIALAAKKFLLFWNDYEIPNNEDLYFLRRYSYPLAIPLPLFGLVAPFALFALVRWTVRGGSAVFPAALIAASLACAMLFFVTARYRLGALPPLIVLASAGVVAVTREIADRRFAGAFLLVPLVVFCNLPVRRFDFAAPESRLAGSFLAAGDVEGAREHYHRALDIDPARAEALSGLAEVYRRTGLDDRALAIYRRLLEIPGAGDDARNDMATLLASRGETDEAARLLEELIDRDPDDAAALTNLAAVRIAGGDPKSAEALLRRSLRIAPESEETLLNLAALLIRAGRRSEASPLVDEVLVLSPDSPRGLFNAGMIRALEGDARGALRFWDRLDAIDPGYPGLDENRERALRLLEGGEG